MLRICYSLTMSKIAEHDAKQKGESDNRIKGWISFAIRCHAIRVDQVLKTSGELVRPVKRRRVFVRVDNIEERWYRTTAETLNKAEILIFDFLFSPSKKGKSGKGNLARSKINYSLFLHF